MGEEALHLRPTPLTETGSGGSPGQKIEGRVDASVSHKPPTCSALLLRMLSGKPFQETHCAGPQSLPTPRLHSDAGGHKGFLRAGSHWAASSLNILWSLFLAQPLLQPSGF